MGRRPVLTVASAALVLALALLWWRREVPPAVPLADQPVEAAAPTQPAPLKQQPQPARHPAAASPAGAPSSAGGTRAPGGRLSRPLVDARPSRFDSLPVVAREESPADRDGHFTRHTVVRASMKYPLIRLDEKVRRDPVTGEETLLSRNEMVADHLMVRLEPGFSQNDLERVVSRLGMKIRKAPVYSKVYLVSFELGTSPGTMVHALDRALAALKSSRGVRSPEPDYIVHAF